MANRFTKIFLYSLIEIEQKQINIVIFINIKELYKKK